VAIANNNRTFSEAKPLFVYDSKCLNCTGNNSESCSLKVSCFQSVAPWQGEGGGWGGSEAIAVLAIRYFFSSPNFFLSKIRNLWLDMAHFAGEGRGKG